MKTNAIIRIVIWSLVIIVLCSVMGSLMFGPSLFRPRYEPAVTSPLTDEEDGRSGNGGSISANSQEGVSVNASDIRKISISWAAGDIRIIAADDIQQIRFSEESVSDSRYQMVYKVSRDELKIQFCQDSIKFPSLGVSVDISKDLFIEVPASWVCQELEIDAAAADLTVENLMIRDVDFDGAAGICDFRNCTIGTLDLDTASGDVTFAGSLNALDFDAASASFTGVFTEVPDRIDMDGMSGDLELTLPENAGFTVTMDGMSSHFRSDFSYSQKSSGTYICGDGSCDINIDAMSSDVYIRKSANPS